MEPLTLRPHREPFSFTDKWADPVWKKRGVYLWSIARHGADLANYAGQCFKGRSCFEIRLWQEFKWWESGQDHAVDIDQFKLGTRIQLAVRPPGHLERGLKELKPLYRLWLMPLDTQAECNQAERWLVAEFCKHPLTRQFLANRNPERYRPDPNWAVRIDAPASFRVIGLTVPVADIPS